MALWNQHFSKLQLDLTFLSLWLRRRPKLIRLIILGQLYSQPLTRLWSCLTKQYRRHTKSLRSLSAKFCTKFYCLPNSNLRRQSTKPAIVSYHFPHSKRINWTQYNRSEWWNKGKRNWGNWKSRLALLLWDFINLRLRLKWFKSKVLKVSLQRINHCHSCPWQNLITWFNKNRCRAGWAYDWIATTQLLVGL
jgi:hypothetical protein